MRGSLDRGGRGIPVRDALQAELAREGGLLFCLPSATVGLAAGLRRRRAGDEGPSEPDGGDALERRLGVRSAR